jgi:hypothetical protein
VTNQAAFVLTIASPAVLFRRGLNDQAWDSVYVNSDENIFFDSMAFWDDREGIAMGDATEECLSVITTRDGGKNWNLLDCSNLPSEWWIQQGIRKQPLRLPMVIWSCRAMRFGWFLEASRRAFFIPPIVVTVGMF